jgi:hypothetical protein
LGRLGYSRTRERKSVFVETDDACHRGQGQRAQAKVGSGDRDAAHHGSGQISPVQHSRQRRDGLPLPGPFRRDGPGGDRSPEPWGGAGRLRGAGGRCTAHDPPELGAHRLGSTGAGGADRRVRFSGARGRALRLRLHCTTAVPRVVGRDVTSVERSPCLPGRGRLGHRADPS